MVNDETQLVDCTEVRHAEAILAIMNHAIVTSTALWDYEPRSMASMATWFAAKRLGNYPVIGIEDASGRLLGFASYGQFRPQPAYKYTVELSIYVHHEVRRQGLANRLMGGLVERARAQDFHVMIGVIESSNEPSIRLHQRHGFVSAGTLMQAGFKFGRWLDATFYQRVLQTPTNPVDG